MSEGGESQALRAGDTIPYSPLDDAGAWQVLRRGLVVSPGLRRGIAVTAAIAITAAAGRLVVPLLIQQTLDRGFVDGAWRPSFVITAAVMALLVVVTVAALSGLTYLRLVKVAENTLADLRVLLFDHLHRMSIARHSAVRLGTMTARVTSDIDQLALFVQWGAMSWITSLSVLTGTIVVMAIFSWKLTIVALVTLSPLVPWARLVQRGQFKAYSELRERVADTISEASEAVSGAAVIRAFGYEPVVRERVDMAAERHFGAQMRAQRFFSLYLPVTDIVGAVALATTAGVGVWRGAEWGLTSGQLVSFLFLVSLLLNPIAEITEVLDQTQTSLAAWRKVLAVLDWPIDVEEPIGGVELRAGALAVKVINVDFAYDQNAAESDACRTNPATPSPMVLSGVSVEIAAGSRVAVVGETGSGKSTFARLLARLADPVSGVVEIGDENLRAVSTSSRRASIRMVPQDGFLFDATIRENVAYGASNADDAAVHLAFEQLGLTDWVTQLPRGLDTEVGERGEQLSVGERQLVALARAALASPGLLILDEATSAVDPETEQILANALDQLSTGRTTISVAHRLSTAERADVVLVFDAGLLVQQGSHHELVASDGPYRRLFAAWLGNTQTR